MAFRFVNLDGSKPHELSAVLKWALVDRVCLLLPVGGVVEVSKPDA